MPPKRASDGFTIIELLIAMAIIAILTAIALPSYTAYIQRSRVAEALDALSAYATRLEQHYQDVGNYADPNDPAGKACLPLPPKTEHPDLWTVTCAVDTNQKYTATATGSGVMNNYQYTIDQAGNRATPNHPNGKNDTCWTTRGTTCDT